MTVYIAKPEGEQIKVGDKVEWVRRYDGQTFSGTVLEIQGMFAIVRRFDRPETRMWPPLQRLTRIDAAGNPLGEADAQDSA